LSWSCQVRQLQLLEEDVEIFHGADGEAEIVLALAVRRALRGPSRRPRVLGLGKVSPWTKLLVAGEHLIAVAAPDTWRRRGSAMALHRDRDTSFAAHVP